MTKEMKMSKKLLTVGQVVVHERDEQHEAHDIEVEGAVAAVEPVHEHHRFVRRPP